MFELVLELGGSVRLGRPRAVGVRGMAAGFREVAVRCQEGAVVIEGVLEADIQYIGTDGRLRSARSETAFVRSLPGNPLAAAAGGAAAGEVQAALQPLDAECRLHRRPGRRWGDEVSYVVRAQCRLERAGAAGPRGGEPLWVSKRLLKVEEVVGTALREAVLDGTVALDPGAIKAIDVQGTLGGAETEVVEAAALVRGEVFIHVYYVDEGGVIRYQHHRLAFEEAAEVPGAAPGMAGEAFARVAGLEYELSPEGLTMKVRALVRLDVKVTRTVELAVVTDVGGAPGLEAVRERVKVEQVAGRSRVRHLCEGGLTLAAPALRVTRAVAGVEQVAAQAGHGQVAVEGVVRAEVFYADHAGREHHQAGELPVTCLVEVAAAAPGMLVQADVRVEEVRCALRGETEARVQAVLAVAVRVTEMVTLDVVTAVPGAAAVEGRRLRVERLVGRAQRQAMAEKKAVLVSRALRLVDVVCTVTDLAWEVIPDQVIVQGKIHQQVFFVDRHRAERHQTEEIPFSYLVEVPGALPGMSAQVRPRVKHVSHSLAPEGNAFSEKVVLELDIRVLEMVELNVITAVSGADGAGRTGAAGAEAGGDSRGEGGFTVRGTMALGRPPAVRVAEARAVLEDMRLERSDGMVVASGVLRLQFYCVAANGLVYHRSAVHPFSQPLAARPAGPAGPGEAVLRVRELRWSLPEGGRRGAAAVAWEAVIAGP